MTTLSGPTTDVWSNRSGFIWEGKSPGFQEDLAYTTVNYDFVKTLGLKLIEGRDFSREFSTDSNAVILNETAVKYMGLQDPIGKFIRDSDSSNVINLNFNLLSGFICETFEISTLEILPIIGYPPVD